MKERTQQINFSVYLLEEGGAILAHSSYDLELGFGGSDGDIAFSSAAECFTRVGESIDDALSETKSNQLSFGIDVKSVSSVEQIGMTQIPEG